MTGWRRRVLVIGALAVAWFVASYAMLNVAASRKTALMQEVPYVPHPAQYRHSLATLADTVLSWSPAVGLVGSIVVALALVLSADMAVGAARRWTTLTESTRRAVKVIIIVAVIHLFVSVGLSLFLSILEPAAAGLFDYRLPVSVQPIIPLFGWPIVSYWPRLNVPGVSWACGVSACLSLYGLNSLLWAIAVYAIWSLATATRRRWRAR